MGSDGGVDVGGADMGSPVMCETGPVYCDGTMIRLCGSGTVATSCMGGERCVGSPGGASCRCEQNTETRCDGGDVYNYDSCGVRGSRVQDCTAPEVCTDDGAGALTCALPTTCSLDSECPQTSWCNTTSGMCEPDVCSTSLYVCDGSESVVLCRSNGSALDVTDTCVGGERCVPGNGSGASCLCVPDDYQACDAGDVYNYNSCGVRGTRVQDCTLPQVCTDNGSGALTCALPTVCTLDTHCPQTSWCNTTSGMCEPDVCSTGLYVCDGNNQALCRSNGSALDVTDLCVGGEQCRVGSGGSASCQCVANAYQACDAGDVYAYDSCGVRGTRVQDCTLPQVCTDNGSGALTCALPTVCTLDTHCPLTSWCNTTSGMCEPDVCSTGLHVCDGNNQALCRSNGSALDVTDTCMGGEQCQVGSGGGALCRCVANAYQACDAGDVYAYDSCGVRGTRVQDCTMPRVCTDNGSGALTCALPTVCTLDSQCPATSWCDTSAGTCEPDVCSTGLYTCDGNNVALCRSNGSALDVTDLCVGGEQCQVGSGGSAVCQCVANASQGCDGGDVYAYDSCGVRGARVQDCTAPQVCTDGGMGALTCAAPTVCTQDSQCLSTSWCDTSIGMCQPDVCSGTLSTCDAGNVVQCRANGSGLDVTDTCTGGELCVTGSGGTLCRCVVDHHLECYQDDVYYYDSCGVRGLRRENCSAPEVCVDDPTTGPGCQLPTVCASNADCYSNSWCHVESGECRPDVCTTVPAFCSGQQVLICGGGGSGYIPLDTCVGGEQCVVNTGGVAECRCVTNASLGCYSTEIYNFNSCGARGTLSQFCTSPQVCQVGGDAAPFCAAPINCTSDSGCAPGSFCNNSMCTPQVCTPGARVCNGDTVQRCDSRGSAYELYDNCTGGEFCDASGGAAVCSCAQDAYQACCNGNVCNFNSCGGYHNVATSCPLQSPCNEGLAGPACRSVDACDDDGDCSAGEFCELEACVPVVCTANQQFCSGESIRVCNANGSDSTLITDCDAGQLCSVVGNAPRCGCVADVAVGCGADGNVHRFDSCGLEGAIVEACGGGLTCVDTGVGATCSDPSSCGAGCVCSNVGTQGCYAGDVYNLTTCNEPASLVEACLGQIECNTIGGPAACRSSVADMGATYYARSCGLTHQIEYPTALEGDCRCSNNRVPSAGIAECVSAQYLSTGTSFGTGPRVRPLPQPHINGGFLDDSTREVYVGVDWSSATHPDSGLVMAINVDNGNRRIVSGGYDAGAGFTETGSGPSFRNVIDVRRGNDGNLYALSVPGSSINLEIVRVNPANGQRTLVWRAQDAGFAQCASGDPARLGVQVHDRGFAVDSTGRFYLGFTNTSPYGEGVGVVRIDANGMGCSFVTRSGALSLNAYFGQDIGTGFAFDRGRYQGFDLRNGKLYAIQHAFLTLVEVDLATGSRTRISSASTSSILGDGPTSAAGMGQRWAVYDSTRDLYWTSGTINRRMMIAVDPATGERTEAFCQSVNPDRPWRDLCLGGALIAGYQNEGGMWVDTNGDLIVVHENFSLVRANLRDGNSIRISL